MSMKLLATAIFSMGFAVGAAAQSPPPAPNATMTDIEGSVSVNQGTEYVPARKDMRLKPGDRVMIREGGEVTIVFDDECRREVEENKIVTIPERSPCAGGVLAEQSLQPGGGSAIGSTRGNGGVWAMVAIVAAIDIWWLQEDEDFVSP
jgi:hypothetical protein